MKKKHDIFDEEDKILLEVFPFPKWIRLLNYFFPKTENNKRINWKKYLTIWVRWAPWLTIFLLLSLLATGSIRKIDMVSVLAVIICAICTLRTIYLFAVALIAKCFGRSPMTPLALAPITPIIGVGLLLMIVLCDWAFFDSKSSRASKNHQIKTILEEFMDHDRIAQEKGSSIELVEDTPQKNVTLQEEEKCTPKSHFVAF